MIELACVCSETGVCLWGFSCCIFKDFLNFISFYPFAHDAVELSLLKSNWHQIFIKIPPHPY